MIIVQMVLCTFLMGPSVDTLSDYEQLTNQLDRKVEWIDHRGNTILTRNEAQVLLRKLPAQLVDPVYSLRHDSNWRNAQCYKIIHITSEEKGFRIFFQCNKTRSGKNKVTKVKVSYL